MSDQLNFDPQRIAERLYQAHLDRDPFTPLAREEGIPNLAEAYEAQDALVELIKQRRKTNPVGYKIGLTSQAMQEMCGIAEPVAGIVFADQVHASGVGLAGRDYGRVGLEFEIAVFLKTDLGNIGAVDANDVLRATSHVCPAIELVDDRGCDYATLDATSLVVDNSWNAGAVFGVPVHEVPELADIQGRICADGIEIGNGYGRDVLGHPFHSVAWLANHLRGRGRHLKAGEFVMTGTLIRTQFPSSSVAYNFRLDDLGQVECRIGIS